MVDLAVELYGIRVGTLTGSSWRDYDFVPERAGSAEFGVGSTVLSESVPLDLRQKRGRAEARRNYFDELRPEGDERRFLAEQAGISESDTLGFLGRYGRDVAGAVEIWDADDPGEPRRPHAEPIDERAIAGLLRDAQAFPLGNLPATGKSLINGVQLKIVLASGDEGWLLPADGYASTHILKPQVTEDSTIIFDEEYGSRLARRLGLLAYDTHLEVFDGVPTFTIERYDRAESAPGRRVHQEDMCQALGIPGAAKYQRSSGQASLARMARLLRTRMTGESLSRLARTTVLAVALGNLDMHAKNLSILHPPDGDPSLAPVYDMVPMAHLDNDGEVALAINGIYRHASITIDDLTAEFETWGLRGSRDTIVETLERTLVAVESETPDLRAHGGLDSEIGAFTRNLLEGRPAGAGD